MFKRRASDPIKTRAAEVDRLRERRDGLAARLREAEDAAEVAVKAQREALVTGDLDGPGVKRIEAETQSALFRRDALADAHDETQRQLADAEERLAADRDRVERERAAADLVTRADQIEVAATALGDHLAASAPLYRALVEAIGGKGVPSEILPGLNRTPDHVGFNILCTALTAALPIEVSPRSAAAAPVRDAVETTREFMSTRMRTVAAALKAGTADVSESRPAPVAPTSPAICIAEVQIALSESIEWYDADGRLVQAPEGGVTLPSPVAEEAIARGMGFPADSAEGLAIIREAQAPDIDAGAVNLRSTRVRRGPPWTRLNMNLHAWVEAERQRQRLAREAA